jgi:orotate phosphoribosyltransferase
MINYSREIAGASLSIGAIKLSPEKPFKWASGFYMPIYNDNRMLLGNYGHRMLVAEGFRDLIKREEIPCDIIAGTSTAGIAPAVSTANLLGLPLAIIENKEVYLFPPELIKSLAKDFYYDKYYDVIASTCPFGIIPGVSLANEKKLPFVYVRQKKKEHGLEQQIEGILKEKQKVHLIDFFLGDSSYYDAAKQALLDKNAGSIKGDIGMYMPRHAPDIAGKNVVVIEDLVSTGGSSIDEVKAYREKGARVTHCLSIFSYGLDKATTQFGQDACILVPLLTYDVLLEVANESEYINKVQQRLLKEWRADPFKWGEKHGFPQEVKK